MSGMCFGEMAKKTSSEEGGNRPRKVLEKLVADTIGNYDEAFDKSRGALIVTDTASNYCWVLTYKSRAEVPGLLLKLFAKLERKYPGKIKLFQSDCGTEFKNAQVQSYLSEKGIEFRTSAPYVKEQNGRAEGRNNLMIQAARSLLHASPLGKLFWSFTLKAARVSFEQTRAKWEKDHAIGSSLWSKARLISIKVVWSQGILFRR